VVTHLALTSRPITWLEFGSWEVGDGAGTGACWNSVDMVIQRVCVCVWCVYELVWVCVMYVFGGFGGKGADSGDNWVRADMCRAERLGPHVLFFALGSAWWKWERGWM
jgi:hypothetical protein